ncbi:hypothetical protein, partial [Brasilonema octagenarum]|uniref:hypothetical protein n=1 Tax=Brasilonema octagenarum TaxID=417105 RepID=UPI001B7CE5B9
LWLTPRLTVSPALREGLPPQATGEPGGLSGVRRGHALRRWKPSSSTGLTKSNRIPIVYWVEHGDHYQKIFAARVC